MSVFFFHFLICINRQSLLGCILEMAHHIVHRKGPGSDDVLLDLVMSRLFLLWISAPHNVTKDLWENFGVSTRFYLSTII